MSEKQFVDGLRAFDPGSKRPDFVKAELKIEIKEFGKWLRAWMEANPGKDDVRIDVNQGKSGSFYAELNTFVPKQGSKDIPPADDIPF